MLLHVYENENTEISSKDQLVICDEIAPLKISLSAVCNLYVAAVYL